MSKGCHEYQHFWQSFVTEDAKNEIVAFKAKATTQQNK